MDSIDPHWVNVAVAETAHTLYALCVCGAACLCAHLQSDTHLWIFHCLTFTHSSVSSGMRVFCMKAKQETVFILPPGVSGAQRLIFHLNVSSLTASHFFLSHHCQENFRGEKQQWQAGDLVFSHTMALSEPSISRQIKLSKSDCVLTRRGKTSQWTQRGTMGFCWSWECGRPLRALLCWLGGPHCAALHLWFLLHDEVHRALHDSVSYRDLQESHSGTGEVAVQ